jgi:hypothetical protein
LAAQLPCSNVTSDASIAYCLTQKIYIYKLGALPDPRVDFAPWLAIMTDTPRAWLDITKLYVVVASTNDVAAEPLLDVSAREAGALALHACPACTARFPSARALAQHARIKHGVRSEWRLYIGADATCPACALSFSSRLRAVAHLSDPRRNRTCRQFVQDGHAPVLEQETLAALDALDSAERLETQRSGATHPLSKRRPFRSPA